MELKLLTFRNYEKSFSSSPLSQNIFSIRIVDLFDAIAELVESFVGQLFEDWNRFEEINVLSYENKNRITYTTNL